MTAWIKDAVMAVGDAEFSVDYSPAVLAELLDGNGRTKRLHLVLSKSDGVGGWTVSDILVLQHVDSSEVGVTIRACSLAWWLGTPGGPGPLITDREYISGNNILSSGDFEFNAFGDPFQGWSISGASYWIQAVGSAHGGAGAAYVSGDPLSDDALVSTEERKATPGQQYYLQYYMLRGPGTVGHMHGRIVFKGRFTHPDISTAYSTWGASTRGDIVLGTDPSAIVAGPTFNIRTVMPNLIPDGTFEDGVGLNGWVTVLGTWALTNDGTAHSGTYMLSTTNGPAWKEIVSDAQGGTTLPANTRAVIPGEEYELSMACRTNPATPTTNGEVKLMAGMAGVGLVDDFIETPRVQPDNGAGSWRVTTTKVSVATGRTAMLPQIVVEGQSTGRWDFDDVTLRRTKGNVDARLGPAITVIPERGYRWSVPYRADLSVSAGRVQLRAVLSGIDRPDQVLTGPELRQPSNTPAAQVAEWIIVPPSGYTVVYLQVYAEDVTGGSVIVGQGTLVDVDASTYVFDVQSPAYYSAWTPNATGTVTAPAGSETVHAEIVAEANSYGWLIDDVFFSRIVASPATILSVFTSLIKDPDTAATLSLAAGFVGLSTTVIAKDWFIHNLNIRDALDLFCTTVAGTPLEWRVDSPARALNIGPASGINDDHAPTAADPKVYVGDDVQVTSIAPQDATAEQVSKVLVVGTEKTATSGLKRTITASASNVTGVVDYRGNALNRTQVVDDSTVDQSIYAAALARDTADRIAQPLQNVTVTLSGDDDRGAPAGDWVYPYKPESGLSDVAYPVEINGEMLTPARKRVLARTRKFAAGYKAEIRRYDGSLLLLDVLWEDDATTVLELGDFRPTFHSDQAAQGNTGRAYLRFRTSTPT